MTDKNNLSIIMEACNFSDFLINYRYGWIRDEFLITKNKEVMFRLYNSTSNGVFISILLKSFGLIEVVINTYERNINKYICFPSVVDYSYNEQNNISSYIVLKNLLISLVNSGNSIDYKFCITGAGTIIWKDEAKKYTFFASSWERFIRYLFDVFKFNRGV